MKSKKPECTLTQKEVIAYAIAFGAKNVASHILCKRLEVLNTQQKEK
ncbi:hypothetical protein lbkm_2625 [Lachnospiraceae bacterium KM106-2]|nr:hypothetical protein lbkm_2625 [Lachnospiraceae bacterium KM106-2]